MQPDLGEIFEAMGLPDLSGNKLSRKDGRIYPVSDISEDHVRELAHCLHVDLEVPVMWYLYDSLRGSVRDLAAFFDQPPRESSATWKTERARVLNSVINNPALALDGNAVGDVAKVTVSDLLRRAATRGIDVETRRGSLAVADLAREVLRERAPRADSHLTIGESNLFDAIVAVLAVIDRDTLNMGQPGHDPMPRATPPAKETEDTTQAVDRERAVNFALEFLGQVVDRTLASFPRDAAVQERLHELKAKSFRQVSEALRAAISRHFDAIGVIEHSTPAN